MKKSVMALFLLGLFVSNAHGDAGPQEALTNNAASMQNSLIQIQQTLRDLQGLLQKQDARIAALEAANAQARPRAEVSASAESFPPATAASMPKIGSGFNPQIGVVGDVVAELSERSLDSEGNDRISFRELEVVFGSYIDPFSRFDVTLSLADFEELGIEDAYITHYGLPWGIKGMLGRFHPKTGKASALHRDSLDTVDEPLVVRRYFGEEGYFRTGAELSKIFELPWGITGELTGGILEGGVGEGGTAFGSTRRRPTFYSHLKTHKEFSDVSDLELGVTHMAGSSDEDTQFEVNVLGLDATWFYYLDPNHPLKWQSEAYLQNRDETFGESSNPWGFYSLVDYRISPRFGAGGRADAVQPVDNAQENRGYDTAWSLYLTFHQSEFARWRLQYRKSDFAAGGDDNTFFLQGTVAIGQHQHKLQ